MRLATPKHIMERIEIASLGDKIAVRAKNGGLYAFFADTINGRKLVNEDPDIIGIFSKYDDPSIVMAQLNTHYKPLKN